ncbi:hypothetical protein Pelo_2709 [Pelomyxa schiedti]|nr:hypothetical protein Pelo_2709 [Pelomyxa schiedti]
MISDDEEPGAGEVVWKPVVNVREQILALATATNARCGGHSAARTLGQHSQMLRALWDVAVVGPGARTWFSFLVTTTTDQLMSVLIAVCPLLKGIYDVKGLLNNNTRKLWVSSAHCVVQEGHRNTRTGDWERRFRVEEATSGSGTSPHYGSYNEARSWPLATPSASGCFAFNGKWWVLISPDDDPSALVIRPILDPDEAKITVISGFWPKKSQTNVSTHLLFNKSLPDEMLVVQHTYRSPTSVSFQIIDVAKTHERHCINSLCLASFDFRDYTHSLLMRKRNGDYVVIVGSLQGLQGVIHHKEGLMSHLSQLNSSLFCVDSASSYNYEIWDCNCPTRPLLVGSPGPAKLNQFVAGSGFLFKVTKKRIQMMEPFSRTVVLNLTFNRRKKKLLKIRRITSHLSFE